MENNRLTSDQTCVGDTVKHAMYIAKSDPQRYTETGAFSMAASQLWNVPLRDLPKLHPRCCLEVVQDIWILVSLNQKD